MDNHAVCGNMHLALYRTQCYSSTEHSIQVWYVYVSISDRISSQSRPNEIHPNHLVMGHIEDVLDTR